MYCICGDQAIIALCMPMAVAAVPGGGLPFIVLLMCMAYAAMQISPTHICLFIAVEYFGTQMGALIRRTVPVIACFCAIAAVYTWVLSVII